MLGRSISPWKMRKVTECMTQWRIMPKSYTVICTVAEAQDVLNKFKREEYV